MYSARYAGPERNPLENTAMLLRNMDGISDRKAQFRTVIALLIKGKTHFFEGKVEGSIAPAPSGKEGFGYDPVFVPNGFSCTFAEMDSAAKNAISHRGKAVAKLLQFLATG